MKIIMIFSSAIYYNANYKTTSALCVGCYYKYKPLMGESQALNKNYFLPIVS